MGIWVLAKPNVFILHLHHRGSRWKPSSALLGLGAPSHASAYLQSAVNSWYLEMWLISKWNLKDCMSPENFPSYVEKMEKGKSPLLMLHLVGSAYDIFFIFLFISRIKSDWQGLFSPRNFCFIPLSRLSRTITLNCSRSHHALPAGMLGELFAEWDDVGWAELVPQYLTAHPALADYQRFQFYLSTSSFVQIIWLEHSLAGKRVEFILSHGNSRASAPAWKHHTASSRAKKSA